MTLLFLTTVVHAAVIEKPLPDATREASAQQLFHALKCVVCEGQSLADSDAQLAIQMRAKVREMLSEGKSEHEVLAFFRESYGERILMQPPLSAHTALLWLAPCLLLLGGGLAVWKVTRGGTHG